MLDRALRASAGNGLVMLNQRRGKNVAAAGAAFQVVLSAVMLAIWLWTRSLAAMSCTWLLAGGILLWLMVSILFYCRLLERREQRELEELTAAGTASSVFQGEQAGQVRPAAARVAWMERWVAPIFTLLWAGYQVAVGILMLRYLSGRAPAELTNTLEGILFLVLGGLLGFLFGRYTVGMSSVSDWRLLRATGSYLLVNVLFVAAAVVSLVVAHYKVMDVDFVVAYAVPIVQIFLAAELVINLILDVYRPRVPGHEQRPSFDSRLLNLAAEPGKVGHSIAETLNYQFGFQVSETWFYRLLRRTLVPLILSGAAVLLGMSCIVVVGEGEVYVVKQWGRLDYARGELGPGIHFKYPYPVETAERFRKGSVHEIMLGAGAERTPEERKQAMIKGRELSLWTQEHGQRTELDFLVAVPPESRATSAGLEGKPPPVSIIKLVVVMDYAITDPYRYGYEFVDAGKLLECIAYREMVRYCAAASLTEAIRGGSADRPEAIMTYGREAAGQRLKDRIQKRADEVGLGVRILRAGLLASHPPKDVAPEYEKVLKAERAQDEKRYLAEAEANQMLSRVAGDPFKALKLAHAIARQGELQRLSNLKPGTEEFRKKLDEYVARAADNIKTLDKEIERERLLGRLEAPPVEGMETLQTLRQAHQSHLAMLKEVARNPSGFPFEKQIQLAASRADRDFLDASGEPVRLVSEAVAERWRTELEERARAEAFAQQSLAYQANGNAYETDLRQEVWSEILPDIRKYVLGVDPARVEIRLHLEGSTGVLSGLRAEQEESTGQ
jgi:regulator of protease activity HflC (stomatin/prohibitin superfamily)